MEGYRDVTASTKILICSKPPLRKNMVPKRIMCITDLNFSKNPRGGIDKTKKESPEVITVSFRKHITTARFETNNLVIVIAIKNKLNALKKTTRCGVWYW